ncbi:MAG: response regulator [Parafilimonas sp.]
MIETPYKLTILLIDDDSIFQFLTRKVLEASGLTDEIIACSNGQEALQLLETNICNKAALPDVIFLDINMPVMNGWAFLEAFKLIKPLLNKPVPLYVVSSSADRADIQQAKEFDIVTDYLVKPIFQEQFKTILLYVGNQKISSTTISH